MRSSAPDIAALPLPIDQWTQPFWDACARREIVIPRCVSCATWRWPPSAFCPRCRSQDIDWRPAGPPRLYSYTIVHRPGLADEDPPALIVPGLVEFPEAGGMRLVAAIVGAEAVDLVIGASLRVAWVAKDATNIPVFEVSAATESRTIRQC